MHLELLSYLLLYLCKELKLFVNSINEFSFFEKNIDSKTI